MRHEVPDEAFPDMIDKMPSAMHVYEIKATASGYISHMDAEAIGLAAMELGAGRRKKEDSIDYTAGIILIKKTSDRVELGETVARLYTNDKSRINEAVRIFENALSYSRSEIEKQVLVYDVL
jgi:pyrimidine-nucleoside phosphorylase